MGTTLKSKKQPDRFARVVEREATRQMAQGRWIWSAKDYTQVVERLLRAEHRAVVRLVQKARHTGKVRTAYQSNREAKCAVISAYTLACDDLLAALNRRIR